MESMVLCATTAFLRPLSTRTSFPFNRPDRYRTKQCLRVDQPWALYTFPLLLLLLLLYITKIARNGVCDRPDRLLLIRLRAMEPLYRNQVKCLYVHAYDSFFLPSRDREEQRQLRWFERFSKKKIQIPYLNIECFYITSRRPCWCP